MKVITLRQPWATLVAEGIKKYEFRSWKTNYRGKILIHAGKSIDKKEIIKYEELGLEFPTGKIIAEANLVDCLYIDEKLNEKITNEHNIAYGNKKRTGYAWRFDNIKKIDHIDNVNGKLGIWNYK